MSEFTERIGIELPVVQAGMGGGVAGHELAAAVSEAGGLGTIGILPPRRLRDEIAAARRLTGRPVAANLLLPFARGGHWDAAGGADVVVTFWGRPRRRTGGVWIHQCGSVQEALAAHAAGADAVIAQGHEAGGHVRGSLPALELLARVRAALPSGFPMLLAGGITGPDDVAAAIDAGADAAVLGTRFLLSEESGAHPAYRQRLLEADETIVTELFGAGWANAPHRVVPNAATERWLRNGRRGPAPIRAVQRLTAPALARLPEAVTRRVVAAQRPSSPMLSAQPPVAGGPDGLVDSGPLYAGETVARIADVRPAAELTRELATRLG
jgi:NAD(P)H-dependent flavin oxidoreductase YrpB (nitropropane dioxygenase family)